MIVATVTVATMREAWRKEKCLSAAMCGHALAVLSVFPRDNLSHHKSVPFLVASGGVLTLRAQLDG
jgi:hypothetical protein